MSIRISGIMFIKYVNLLNQFDWFNKLIMSII